MTSVSAGHIILTQTQPTINNTMTEHLLRYEETKRKSHEAILIFNQAVLFFMPIFFPNISELFYHFVL